MLKSAYETYLYQDNKEGSGKAIRYHMPNEALKTYFLCREGQHIERPQNYAPLKDYLEVHRKGGEF